MKNIILIIILSFACSVSAIGQEKSGDSGQLGSDVTPPSTGSGLTEPVNNVEPKNGDNQVHLPSEILHLNGDLEKVWTYLESTNKTVDELQSIHMDEGKDKLTDFLQIAAFVMGLMSLFGFIIFKVTMNQVIKRGEDAVDQALEDAQKAVSDAKERAETSIDQEVVKFRESLVEVLGIERLEAFTIVFTTLSYQYWYQYKNFKRDDNPSEFDRNVAMAATLAQRALDYAGDLEGSDNKNEMVIKAKNNLVYHLAIQAITKQVTLDEKNHLLLLAREVADFGERNPTHLRSSHFIETGIFVDVRLGSENHKELAIARLRKLLAIDGLDEEWEKELWEKYRDELNGEDEPNGD